MIKYLTKALCTVTFLLFVLHLNAQLKEAGIHLGYNLSKFKLKENTLNDAIFLREGKSFHGGTIGLQYMLSPPRQQNVPFLKVIPSLLFEASLCRCGGNLELITTLSDSASSFNELQYILYRGVYSAKIVANMKNLNFMLGPTFSNIFYAGVTYSGSDSQISASEQFSLISVGYEVGVGYRTGQFNLSVRMGNLITAFGRETDLFPTQYNYKEYRFMLHYFFLRKHKGANWDSIYGM